MDGESAGNLLALSSGSPASAVELSGGTMHRYPPHEWRDPPAVPLDLNGPVGLAFDPMPDGAVELPLARLFATAAAKVPSKIAVEDGKAALRYDQALAIGERLAAAVEAAVPPGGVVGLAMPLMALTPLGMLAVMASGRVAVPIDPHLPPQSAEAILKAAGARAVLVDGAGPAGCIPEGLPRLDARRISQDAAAVPALAGHASDPYAPAVVLYTSGTTGEPKGIVNSQAALIQRVVQHRNACHIRPDDRMVCLSSICNISGTREMLTGLLTGASIHLIDPKAAGLEGTLARIGAVRPTISYMVPTLLRSLLRRPGAGAAFAALRVARLGGEPVHWADAALVRSRLPRCLVMNAYSSTETIGTQWFAPPEAGEEEEGVMPAGHVLPGSRFLILDQDGTPLPPGAEGELVLRGRFTALGHWVDGRCVPGPMQPDPEDPKARIFATGDRAVLAPDGLLRVLGRVDGQVKINGQRVEPGGIEAVMRRWADVADAAVIVRRSDGGAASLVGFLVPRQAGDRELLALARSRLRASLPAALQPARLHLVGEIPRSSGGKTDRRALAAIDAAQPPPAAARPTRQAALPSEAALAVAQAWRRSFGRRSLRADEAFDTAGGDSLKLIRLIYDIEQRLGAYTFLPLDLFTVGMRPSEMVAAIEQAGRPAAGGAPDDRPPLFLLPGLNGDEPLLALFRADLAPPLRCVTLRYPEWRELARPGYSLDQLAESLGRQIAAMAGGEPVRLAGYSFGGGVAAAVALHLRQHGVPVCFLGLIDAGARFQGEIPPGPALRVAIAGQGVMRQAVRERRLQDVLGMILAETLSRPRLAPALRALARMRRLPPLPMRMRFACRAWLHSLLRAALLRRWYARLAPQQVADVPVTLFRSEEHAPDEPADLGWSAIFRDVALVEVPGTHHTIFEAGNRAVLVARFIEAASRPRASARSARRTAPA
jgi:acyl-coenzyme A synthetase/AMP-(fatty) acid ligase/thioesterase domain-containing protein